MMRALQSMVATTCRKHFSTPNLELYKSDLKNVTDDIQNRAWSSAIIRIIYIRDFFAKFNLSETKISMLLCYVYLHIDMLNDALELCTNSIVKHEENTDTLTRTQTDYLLLKLNQLIKNEIIKDYKNSQNTLPQDVKTLCSAGKNAMKKKDYPGAIQIYSLLLDKDCRNPEYRAARYCALLCYASPKSIYHHFMRHDGSTLEWLAKDYDLSGTIIVTLKKYLDNKFKNNQFQENFLFFISLYIHHSHALVVNKEWNDALACLTDIKKYTLYLQSERTNTAYYASLIKLLNSDTAQCVEHFQAIPLASAIDQKPDAKSYTPATTSAQTATAAMPVAAVETTLPQPPATPLMTPVSDSKKEITLKKTSAVKPKLKLKSGNKSAAAKEKRDKHRQKLHDYVKEQITQDNQRKEAARIAREEEAAAKSEQIIKKCCDSSDRSPPTIQQPPIAAAIAPTPLVQPEEKTIVVPASVSTLQEPNPVVAPLINAPASTQQQPMMFIQALYEVPTIRAPQILAITQPCRIPLIMEFPAAGYYQINFVPMLYQPPIQMQPDRFFHRQNNSSHNSQQQNNVQNGYHNKFNS